VSINAVEVLISYVAACCTVKFVHQSIALHSTHANTQLALEMTPALHVNPSCSVSAAFVHAVSIGALRCVQLWPIM
jgi:hypothetical protein